METNNSSQTLQHQGSDILNELLKSVNSPQEVKSKVVTTEVRQLFIGNVGNFDTLL